MKTLNTLVLVLVTLFISLTSFSQDSTHVFTVEIGPTPGPGLDDFLEVNVVNGDKIQFNRGDIIKQIFYKKVNGISTTLVFITDTIFVDVVNGNVGETLHYKVSSGQYEITNVKFTIIAQAPVVVGVNTLSDIKFNIFPNPTTDFLNITTSDNIQSVKVFDVNGRIVLSKDFDAADVKLDVSKLEKGIYSVVVNGNSKMTFIKE